MAAALLVLVWREPGGVSGEKLSVLLPGQNAEFDLDHYDEQPDILDNVDVRLGSVPTGPQGRLSPPTPQLQLAQPPAPVVTSRPGTGDIRANLPFLNAPAISGEILSLHTHTPLLFFSI